MEEDADFATLYKKLIDRHFTPERERGKAALRRILGCLSASPEVPLEKNGQL